MNEVKEVVLEAEVSDFNIALSGNELLQKFIARRVAKELEVSVTYSTGGEVTGFITGLDEDWLQVTSTRRLSSVLINLSTVGTIQSTGRHLRDLPPRDREKVKGYLFAIKKTSVRELELSQ